MHLRRVRKARVYCNRTVRYQSLVIEMNCERAYGMPERILACYGVHIQDSVARGIFQLTLNCRSIRANGEESCDTSDQQTPEASGIRTLDHSSMQLWISAADSCTSLRGLEKQISSPVWPWIAFANTPGWPRHGVYISSSSRGNHCRVRIGKLCV